MENVANGEVINLARIPSFVLGALHVVPATLQLQRAGRSKTLEPRVMQVLVTLWQADGGVVTRDDLIARCWGGRIVGHNAIHRTISRLREVAAGFGGGCFQLETVNKIGYRLILPKAAATSLQTADGHPQAPQRSGTVIAGAAIAFVAVVAALIGWTRSPAPDSPTIAILAAQTPYSAELARGLAVDLAHLDNEHGNTVVLAKGSAPIPADYILSVAEQSRDAHPQADLTLLKNGSSELLWSARIDGPGDNAAILRQRASSAVSRVTACASRIVPDPAHSIAEFLRLVFSACDIHDEQPDNTAVRLWRSIVAKQPGNAPAVAALALAEAELAESARWNDVAKSSEIAALRSAARQHLEKARALNGRLGETWAAEALLMPSSPYGAQLAVLEDGRARDPDSAPLYGMRSQVLQNVGRMNEAIDSARRAVELEPSAARWRANLAMMLVYAGYTESARSELASAERIWPDSPDLQEARSHVELRFGDPVAMIRKIDRGSVMPNSPPEFQNGVMRTFLLARANPDPRNIEAAVNASSQGAYATYTGLQNLVTLGQVNKAYALLNDRFRMAALRKEGSYVLFRVNMRAFRLDRRFMPLADRLGLVQYWLSGNVWPDFCNDKDLPYSCRTEARRLHAKNA